MILFTGENGDSTSSSTILPYFIFVAPPNIEKMRQMRMRMSQKVDEEELKTIKEDAQVCTEWLFVHDCLRSDLPLKRSSMQCIEPIEQ